ncbi:mechanosensitive ion channel family protein [Aquiflexum sp.]|uniref:mechanosensitive ion channel family protein n=1 Tax=Aquiflexum sp. TaxID=1872584 RepID=UPI003593082C
MYKEFNLFMEDIVAGLSILLPRILLALGILLAGYLIGRLVEKMVRRFILYLNKSINLRLQSSLLNVDLASSAWFISKTFFWVILITSLLFCLQILDLTFSGLWFEKIMTYLPNVIVAVIIIFVGIIFGRLLGDLTRSAATKTGLVNGGFLGNMVRYLLLLIAIVIAIGQIGVDIAFLTNLITIILVSLLFGASLAFGLGAQTSVSNILGAYYVRKSYSLGNEIEVNGQQGVIVKMTDYSVTIETKTGLANIPAREFNDKTVMIIKKKKK